MKIDTRLAEFNFDGAPYAKVLTEDDFDTIEQILSDRYPDGITQEDLRGLFTYYPEELADMLGYKNTDEFFKEKQTQITWVYLPTKSGSTLTEINFPFPAYTPQNALKYATAIALHDHSDIDWIPDSKCNADRRRMLNANPHYQYIDLAGYETGLFGSGEKYESGFVNTRGVRFEQDRLSLDEVRKCENALHPITDFQYSEDIRADALKNLEVFTPEQVDELEDLLLEDYPNGLPTLFEDYPNGSNDKVLNVWLTEQDHLNYFSNVLGFNNFTELTEHNQTKDLIKKAHRGEFTVIGSRGYDLIHDKIELTKAFENIADRQNVFVTFDRDIAQKTAIEFQEPVILCRNKNDEPLTAVEAHKLRKSLEKIVASQDWSDEPEQTEEQEQSRSMHR